MELHFMNPSSIERDSLCYNRSVLILRSLGIVRVFVLSTRFFSFSFFFFIKKFLLMQVREVVEEIASRKGNLSRAR